MKSFILTSVLCIAMVATLHAGPRASMSYRIATDSIDDGGGRAYSAAYATDGSTGGLAGLSAVTASAEAARSGFIGQLYEVVGLAVTTSATAVNAGDGVRLDAWRKLDDSTLLADSESRTFQWYRNNTAIASATESIYALSNVQLAQSGAYSVRITEAGGSVVDSDSVTFSVITTPGSRARLLNLSTRAIVPTAGDNLIPGFVISGVGTKSILVRAVGPTLAESPFKIENAMSDPQMTVKRYTENGSVDFASNDNWSTNANAAQIASTTETLGGFGLASGSADAALLIEPQPGAYTVVTTGVNGSTGIAIVELYDADSDTPTSQLVNISNRGFVGVGGNIMIPGFVISEEGPKTVLVRAVGPTLEAEPFNVDGVLVDPNVTLFSGSAEIASNDDWSDGSDAATVASAAEEVGAFALPPGSKDAALVATLPPGVFTVQARGVGNTTGIALVEIYIVP